MNLIRVKKNEDILLLIVLITCLTLTTVYNFKDLLFDNKKTLKTIKKKFNIIMKNSNDTERLSKLKILINNIENTEIINYNEIFQFSNEKLDEVLNNLNFKKKFLKKYSAKLLASTFLPFFMPIVMALLTALNLIK